MAQVPSLDWLDPARDPALFTLVVLAVALLAVTVVFSVYAVVLRIRNDRREQRRTALAARWQDALLTALADSEKTPDLHRLVDPNRQLHFVGFVLQFARRVRGEETGLLRDIVRPFLGSVVARLDSDRVEVRARAVQTLGTLGLPDHERRVIEALADPSPLVAMVAARALAKEGDPQYAEFILAKIQRFTVWNRPYLASMLAAMGPEISAGLRRGLADPGLGAWARSVLAEALHIQRDFVAGDVAAGVVATTDQRTAEERDLLVSALRLLAEVGRPEHVPVVRARLETHDVAVRAQALRALGRLGGQADLPLLVEALDDAFAWSALYAARGVRDAGGRDFLVEAAKSSDRRGRLAAQVLAEEGAR